MYCFNDDRVTFRYIDLKALYKFLRIPKNPLMNAQTLGPSQ